jgi:glycosyltransferase involved in cell wall biosynthesis
MVLTPYLPHRRVGHGGGTAVRDLVRHLAVRHEVLVVSLMRTGEEHLVKDVENLGVKVAPLPFQDKNSQGIGRLKLFMSRGQALTRSLISGFPLYVEKYWSPLLSRQILDLVEEFEPDAIQFEYLQLALFCRDIRKWKDATRTKTPVLVLNSHELGSLPRERRAARSKFGITRALALLEATSWRKLQVASSEWADRTLCVTRQDYDLYTAMGGKNLTVVPLGMDTNAIGADWKPELPERFLFVGSFGHRPNVLAAEFLIHEVWPTIAGKRPHAQLILAGRGSDDFLLSLGTKEHWQSRNIKGLGFVEDLTPHFRTCRLFVAPLPEGGGIKIKILETMARGVPVVTTEVGVEGISSAEDDTAIVASCDHSFATAVMALADDMPGSEIMAQKARTHIEDHFSWKAIADRLGEIYSGKF